MRIPFHGSPRPTLGVEVEVALVDVETRALANEAVAILEELGAAHPDRTHPQLKAELFQSIVEAVTGVCDTVGDARADLERALGELRDAAETRGLTLVCCGTHPFTHWSELEVTPAQRYLDLVETIGWPARRLAICGIHFHVGVPTADHAAALVHPLAVHLPIFLALSASSPYRHGIDSHMASSRTKVFEGLPTAGLPPRLDDWADFERFMATLLNANVIATIREVWWDVRPHPDFGTVELRMCDGITNLTEVMALAALAQCLVADMCARIDRGEPLGELREWVIRENKWLAARHGLDTSFIVDDRGTRVDARELVAQQVERLAPMAALLGCTDELADVVRIVERGPSYRRQRALVDDGASLSDLVDSMAIELAKGRPTW